METTSRRFSGTVRRVSVFDYLAGGRISYFEGVNVSRLFYTDARIEKFHFPMDKAGEIILSRRYGSELVNRLKTQDVECGKR